MIRASIRVLALALLVLGACGVETFRQRAPRHGVAIHLVLPDRVETEDEASPGDSDDALLLPRADQTGTLRVSPQPLVAFANIRHVRLLEAAEGNRVLILELDDLGRDRLAEASSMHIGDRIAIVADGHVIAAPIVRTALTEGEAYVGVPGDRIDATFEALSEPEPAR